MLCVVENFHAVRLVFRVLSRQGELHVDAPSAAKDKVHDCALWSQQCFAHLVDALASDLCVVHEYDFVAVFYQAGCLRWGVSHKGADDMLSCHHVCMDLKTDAGQLHLLDLVVFELLANHWGADERRLFQFLVVWPKCLSRRDYNCRALCTPQRLVTQRERLTRDEDAVYRDQLKASVYVRVS
jgi:hypothetical protein